MTTMDHNGAGSDMFYQTSLLPLPTERLARESLTNHVWDERFCP